MPDLLSAHSLADLGQASVAALWLPLAAWTVLAGLSEVTLRLSRAHAMAAVRVRSALLLALPMTLLAPPILAVLLPDAAHAVAAARPPLLALPDNAVVFQPADPTPPRVTWIALGVATLGALLVSALGLLRWIRSLVQLRRVRASLHAAPESVQRLAEQTSQQLGLRRAVEVTLCEPGIAPFTFGWRLPVVAVPPTLTGESLRLALAHELVHVRHRDFLWNTLEQSIASLGLAHPLVHVIAQGAALGREQAADAAVLAARPADRRPYADLLLSYASLPAPGLTLGATQGSSLLHSRIAAMKRTLSSARLRQLVVAGRSLGLLAAVLLIGGATALAVPEALPERPEWLEGRVTDAATQRGIPAANLVVVDTTIGAATGPDGAYRLKRPDGAFRLRVTARGYVEQIIDIGVEQSELDIALRPSSDRLVTPGAPGTLGPDAPEVFMVVEDPPQLVGGLEGLQQRVDYPDEARRAGIQGRVFVEFIVDEEGAVQNPRVARSPDPILSKAALDAVRASEFVPGRQRGQAVKVRFSLPISFVLADEAVEDGGRD